MKPETPEGQIESMRATASADIVVIRTTSAAMTPLAVASASLPEGPLRAHPAVRPQS
jgi:hypothetical protein